MAYQEYLCHCWSKDFLTLVERLWHYRKAELGFYCDKDSISSKQCYVQKWPDKKIFFIPSLIFKLREIKNALPILTGIVGLMRPTKSCIAPWERTWSIKWFCYNEWNFNKCQCMLVIIKNDSLVNKILIIRKVFNLKLL